MQVWFAATSHFPDKKTLLFGQNFNFGTTLHFLEKKPPYFCPIFSYNTIGELSMN
jgi:hypothetical protein